MGPETEKHEQVKIVAVKIGKGIPPTETKEVFAEISAAGNTFTANLNIEGKTADGEVKKGKGIVPADAVAAALNNLSKQGLNDWFVTD